MKKITLFIILLISMSSVTAQYRGGAAAEHRRGDIELGGNIGLNISIISGDMNGEDLDFESATSINIAASGEYYFSDRWGLKVKALYDKKGSVDDDSDSSTSLDYISVPVLANWHFGKTRNWYLNFGIYGAFLIKAEEDTDRTIDVKESFNTTDFGLAFGIGVKFPLNERTKLFIEYDVQSGLTNISDIDSITARNGRSAFNLGVLFDL